MSGWALVILLAFPMGAAQVDTLSLLEAVEIGRSQNLSVRRARAVEREAHARVWSAAGRLLPEVTASAGYQRNFLVNEVFLPAVIFDSDAAPDELIPVRFGADNQWQAQVSVSVPLVDATAWMGAAGARLSRNVAAADTTRAVRDAIAEIQVAYLDALLARERAGLANETAGRLAAVHRDARAREAAGLATGYDVLRLGIAARSARTDARRAESEWRAAKRKLALAVGWDPDRPFKLAGGLGAPIETAASEGTATPAPAGPEDALNRRADVRAAVLQIRIARQTHEVARTEFLPKISAFGTLALTAQENGSPSFFGERPGQRTVAVAGGVRVELPVLNAGLVARTAETGAALRAAELAREEVERAARAELRNLAAALEEAEAAMRDRHLAAEEARRGLAIARAELNAGEGSQLTFTDARLARDGALFAFAEAKHSFLLTWIRAERAAGRVPDPAALECWLRPPTAVAAPRTDSEN